MELVYLVLLLCALLAMNWRFLGLHRLSGRLGGRSCRWRRDARRAGADDTRFVCATCGAEAFRSNGAAPKVCLRTARPH